MRETGALLSAILRVTHPDLYMAGRNSLIKIMSDHPNCKEAIARWPTVFNMVQIISNRQTPFHRDVSGQPTWYDLLVTLGSYQRATLALRNIGIRVAYRPGSIALISSLLLHHGVAEVDPDRLCYSWFMTDAVHTNQSIPTVSWMRGDRYPLPL